MQYRRWSHGSRPPAIGNEQLKLFVETDPCTTVRPLTEKLNVDASTVTRHLKQIG